MSFNTLLPSFLPRQLNFPKDGFFSLTSVLDKMYIDIASRVNDRTIGLYAINSQIVTGNAYYITGEPNKQQSLRMVFTFTSTASITHGINFSQLTQFVPGYGSYTDGTNFYGLIYGSNIAIAGQISFYITPTQIVFETGAGAPTLTEGILTVEWLTST